MIVGVVGTILTTGLLVPQVNRTWKSQSTIAINYRSILNYFINRSTNASAESFNAKIKAFRTQFRGIKNVESFLFRLTRIFA